MTRPDTIRPASEITPGRIGLYALMTVIWGAAFFFTALALKSFSPILIVQLRTLMATACLGMVVLATRRRLPRGGRLWFHFVVLGLISIALPYTLLTIGQVWVSSSTAIVLSSTSPIFVFLLGIFVFRSERFDLRRLFGIVVAFIGVVMLTTGGRIGSDSVFWSVVIVLTSGVFATANLYTRTFVSSVDPMVTALLQLGFGALWMLPVTTFTGSWQVEDPSLLSILALLELGTIGTAATYVMFFYFIRTWGSTATSLNTYLQPVVGVLLGVLILGERPSLLGWAALAIIGCGVALFAWASLRGRAGALEP